MDAKVHMAPVAGFLSFKPTCSRFLCPSTNPSEGFGVRRRRPPGRRGVGGRKPPPSFQDGLTRPTEGSADFLVYDLLINFGSFLAPFGFLLAICSPLGSFWRPCGSSWGPLGRFRLPFGPFWHHFGGLGAQVGELFGDFGSILVPSPKF